MAQDSKKPSENQVQPETEAQEALEGSLETIKEIIVGQYSRDVQQRLVQLDARLTRDLSNVQEQEEKRDQALENFIRRELEILRDEIKLEQHERGKSMSLIKAELTSSLQSLEQKLAQSNQAAAGTFREIRDQMLHQYQQLSDDIASRQKTLTQELETAVSGLENRKPDRKLIAAMIIRMANALQADPIAQEESKPAGSAKIMDIKSKIGKKSA